MQKKRFGRAEALEMPWRPEHSATLNLSFSLSQGLFEIDLSDTRLCGNNLKDILASPNISSMVKHLFVAHPVDFKSAWVERMNRSQEKGMIYEK